MWRRGEWKFLESRCSAHLCRGVLCAGAPVVYVFELFAPFSPPESHSELFDVGASYFLFGAAFAKWLLRSSVLTCK